MDFFAEQDAARKRTKWLVFYFILAMLATGLGIYASFKFVEVTFLDPKAPWWSPLDAVYIIGGTSVVVALGSLGKLARLSGGGAVVASDLGGRPVDPTTQIFEERQLLNVVEEMAIASGIPAPQVWILDQEQAINAFAAGTEPGNAVIGVTRGTIERLDRSELQGVIAHEFSHILNGDMRLNMRLLGWIFGIIMIGLLGRWMIRILYYSGGGRSRSNDGKNVGMALMVGGILLCIVGAMGEFFARLIQAAISRQREFLADASAVQFTRDPSGLAGALKSAAGGGAESKLISPMAGEASHMFFASSGLFSWGLASHPPLEVRIKKLEPDWDGTFSSGRDPSRRERQREKKEEASVKKESGDGVFRVAQAAAVLAGLGQSSAADLEQGQSIRSSFKPSWLEAIHDRRQAQALVFGLLVAQDKKGQAAEFAYLVEALDQETADLAADWHEELSGLHSASKIALIDLALPTLRTLSRDGYFEFMKVTEWLIASDLQVNLFEFMLQQMVSRHLAGHFSPEREAPIRFKSLASLQNEAEVILSIVAGVSGSAASRDRAFDAGSQCFEETTGQSLSLLPPEACGLGRLNDALNEARQATSTVKKQLIVCCGQAVMEDEQITSHEAEILRTIADAIGVAVPPFVDFSAIKTT